MLSIRWGTTEDTIELVDSVFDNNYEDEWLNDPVVKEMVLDVDKSQISPIPVEDQQGLMDGMISLSNQEVLLFLNCQELIRTF